MTTWMRNLVWLAVVLGALWVMGQGLLLGFQIEPTQEALTEMARGTRLVTLASLVLGGAAGFAAYDGCARWVTAGLLVPVVLCGGPTWLAPETLFSLMAAVVAYPIALAAAVGGLRRRRHASVAT
jgi:hypothetical protein